MAFCRTADSILSYFEISPNGQDWTRFKRAWLWYRPSDAMCFKCLKDDIYSTIPDIAQGTLFPYIFDHVLKATAILLDLYRHLR